MSKHPKLANTKKAGGNDKDHPKAVKSNSKVILTVCLYACARTCVCQRA